MPQPTPIKDQYFTSFEEPLEASSLPNRFTFFIENKPHPLCLLAAEKLQAYLKAQDDWHHNFGLSPNEEGTVIGKMFGVLVVKTLQNEVGYLAAFSGKLAGGNHHSKFVPPVFDSLTDNSFLNNGMLELTRINEAIRKLEALNLQTDNEHINHLKTERRQHSSTLQTELFNHYHFLNQAGEEKSIHELFKTAGYKNPPSGAGECAAPKLLQYAFQHTMKPLAIAEFWWGLSPKSNLWQHGHFYPCCREKCEPILAHMLTGLN